VARNGWPGFWIAWTISRAESGLGHVVGKARFWEAHRDKPINDRHRLMLNKLMDGFEGKLNSSK
jgi:hypothetical protein